MSYKKTASHVHIIVVVKPVESYQLILNSSSGLREFTKHRDEAEISLAIVNTQYWPDPRTAVARDRSYVELLFLAHFRHVDPILLRKTVLLHNIVARDRDLHNIELSIIKCHPARREKSLNGSQSRAIKCNLEERSDEEIKGGYVQKKTFLRSSGSAGTERKCAAPCI
jgi:hypothetical protein